MNELEVEARIYNMSELILMGVAKKEEIQAVTELASEHGMLALWINELNDINDKIVKQKQ